MTDWPEQLTASSEGIQGGKRWNNLPKQMLLACVLFSHLLQVPSDGAFGATSQKQKDIAGERMGRNTLCGVTVNFWFV